MAFYGSSHQWYRGKYVCVKYLSMLSGIVFFTHQVGFLFGGWLGGVNHDLTGNHNVIWLCSIALSILGVIVHFFVNEEAVIHDA